jgi:hypothetical protein
VLSLFIDPRRQPLALQVQHFSKSLSMVPDRIDRPDWLSERLKLQLSGREINAFHVGKDSCEDKTTRTPAIPMVLRTSS